MTVFRAILVAAAAAFTGLIVGAAGQAAIGESFARIVADPWGVVTLVDLYGGFVLTGLVIALVDERKAVAIPIVAGLLVLGNVVAFLWFAWRLPLLHARLTTRGS